jgi:glutamate--cysteine ligase
MVKDNLHAITIKKSNELCDWYESQMKGVSYPIYSSYDIRDSGHKVTNVDANIYPAGFNNICPTDLENIPELFDRYLMNHYKKRPQRILLLTEQHTQNPFYWDNVWTLLDAFKTLNIEIIPAFPTALSENLILQSARGHRIEVQSAHTHSKLWQTFKPDLILSNNDFSDSLEDWANSVDFPVNPPREMGWYQRKKSNYFKHYNLIVNEFSKIAGLDPFIMRVETEHVDHFDISDEKSREDLAEKVNSFLLKLESIYRERKIEQKPFVFVKNNSGTYGLAVIKVSDANDIKNWSYKSRKKMKAAKGGREVEEVIIQEGIPSKVKADDASAEPVIYMVGCQLAGGFLRTHSEKDSTESLNSPGAVYKKLCVTDLLVRPEECSMENVYGWTAKLGLLAIGREAQEMKVKYRNFIQGPC